MLRRRRFLIATAMLSLAAELVAAVEPLATAGIDQRQVAAALSALGHDDPATILALPPRLTAKPPALADPDDPDLFHNWLALLPVALARLSPARQAELRATLATMLMDERLVAQAFDRGRLSEVLLLAPRDPRADAARTLLGVSTGTIDDPALPMAGSGALPALTNSALAHADGWLFALIDATTIRWQRRLERHAQVALGVDGALVSQTSGLSLIDLSGQAHALPRVPEFAQPLAVQGEWAWFRAGATVWRLHLSTNAVTTLTLPEVPLGPPVLRGADAWWLTRHALLTTRGAQITRTLPHVLALSPVATLQALPSGAVIRDGEQWWTCAPLSEALPELRLESRLLAGDDVTAEAAAMPELSPELRFRVTLRAPRTPQEHAISALRAARAGDPQPLAALSGECVLTESATNLHWPVTAWPHRVSLRAWRTQDDLAPTISLTSDARQVTLRATWPAPERWWQRTWSTRPQADAPARTWALVQDVIAVLDGADRLLIIRAATGELLFEHDLPAAVDPSAVQWAGDHGAALAEGNRVVLLFEANAVRRVVLPLPALSLTPSAATLSDGRVWSLSAAQR